MAVIPCMGKESLDRPLVIFRSLGIRTYLIWDCDEGGDDPRVDTNRRLLRLLDHDETDYPNLVESSFACFGKDLECTLREEIGADFFDKILKGVQDSFEIAKKEHALKNPKVIQEVLAGCRVAGKPSRTVDRIVEKIVECLDQDSQ